MVASTLARSLPTSILRRWRSLRLWARITIALLVAMAALAGIAWRGTVDDWPARAVLKTTRDTWSLAFSPDGRTFLTSGPGGITPWDTITGEPGTPWTTRAGWFATTGAYSPDGRTFAAAIVHHPDSAIALIDPATGRTRATLRTRHPSIHRVAFEPDGRAVRAYLGSGPDLVEVATWDASTGEPLSRRELIPPIRGATTAISPDGRTLAYIRTSANIVPPTRSLVLRDLEGERPLAHLNNPSRVGVFGPGLAFSADGRALAVGRDDGAIDLWDVAGRKLLGTIPGHSGGYASSGLRFSPDGRTIASVGHDTFRGRSPLGRFQDDIARRLFGSTRRSDPEVIVVDVATGRRLARAVSSLYPIYSPDGKTVVTRQDDLSVRLRDLPDSPP